MKNTVVAVICIFIVLFALANQCDKSVPDNPQPTVENKSYPIPTKAGASPQQVNTNMEANICQICNNRFTGRGFTEVSNRQWHETKEPYQSFICSYVCGMQHTKNWAIKLQKLHSNTSSIRPTQGHQVTSNESEYVDEPCGLCGGSGIESNRYGDSRVCIMCDGTGKRNN